METIVIDIQTRYQDKTKVIDDSAASVDKFSQSVQKMKQEAGNAETALSKIWNMAKKIGGTIIKLPIKVLDYATQPLRSIFNFATSIRGVITGIILGGTFNKFIKSPMALSDTMESSMIFFEKKLGSVKAAEDMIASIQKFDEKSPFNTVQIIQTSQAMLAMGFEAESLLDKLGIIGDVSAGLGKGTEGVEGIARALGEMRMKGSLSGQEFMQLTTHGVTGKDYVKRAFGKTYEEVNKDIKAGKLTVDEAINGMLEEMRKDYGGAAAAGADRTLSGIWGQVESVLQSKVYWKWGQGLAKGAKEGLGVFKKLLEDNQGNIEKFGEKLYVLGEQISTWSAKKVDKAFKDLFALTERADFKNANMSGKVKLVWDEIIAQPFEDWWGSTGKKWTTDAANRIGSAIGNFYKGGILAILGIDKEKAAQTIEDGATVGRSFAEGFLQGFDAKTVWQSILEAGKNLFNDAKTVLPGGKETSKTGWLSAGILAFAGYKLGLPKLAGGLLKGGKGLFGLFNKGGAAGATGAASVVDDVVGAAASQVDDYAKFWSGKNLLNITGRGDAIADYQKTWRGSVQTANNTAKTASVVDDVSLGAIKLAGKTMPTLGKVGKFLKSNWLSLLFAGVSIAAADDKVGETVRQGGGLAGSIAGTKGGAALGGTVGSFFGPAGTAIGAGIGGLAGGIGGFFAGEAVTGWIYKQKDTIAKTLFNSTWWSEKWAGVKNGAKGLGKGIISAVGYGAGYLSETIFNGDWWATKGAAALDWGASVLKGTGEYLEQTIFNGDWWASKGKAVTDWGSSIFKGAEEYLAKTIFSGDWWIEKGKKKLSWVKSIFDASVDIADTFSEGYEKGKSQVEYEKEPLVDLGGGLPGMFTEKYEKGYATGTVSATRGLHWVGEKGPELVKFNGGERVYNAAQSRAITETPTLTAQNTAVPQITLGGINIYIDGASDPQGIMEAIRKQMPGIANELCEYLYRIMSRGYSNMPA